MFVCKLCLAEHYVSPKWEDVFNRSVGPCDRCGRNDVCARVQTLIPKEPLTSWRCAASMRPGCSETCNCDPIHLDEGVIEISRDSMGGIRCTITTPNPQAAHPEYTRSLRCASELIKSHLRAYMSQSETVPPKMLAWPHPQGKPYVLGCLCGTYPECRP